MKHLALILPVTLLAACASTTPKKVVIVPAVAAGQPVADPTNVRRAEAVTEYRFGRYVDPGDRLVMHEAHPVYRVEQTAGWNVHPQGTGVSTAVHGISAVGTTLPDDAVVAEINKQKAATRVFTEEAATLNQRLAGLSEAINQTKQIAQQELLQQRDIAALKSRLNTVETERAAKSPGATTSASDKAEENW
jgi:hypothetical protein